MGGASVDWFDLRVDVLVIGTTRLAIGDRTADLDLLERALDRLSLADRTLLALHRLEHLSLGEIGAQLGVPGKTVKSRLFSARRSLERAPICGTISGSQGRFGRERPASSILGGQHLESNS
jgi:hypothetical protein